MFLSDPERVHELLASALIAVLVPTVVVAMAYIYRLGEFFAELRRREPAVWEQVGSPDLPDMVLSRNARFRNYLAFYPVLRERAKAPDSNYRHACSTWLLLRTGLALCGLLFIIVAAQIAVIVIYQL